MPYLMKTFMLIGPAEDARTDTRNEWSVAARPRYGLDRVLGGTAAASPPADQPATGSGSAPWSWPVYSSRRSSIATSMAGNITV
jgi:hypothetical protein